MTTGSVRVRVARPLVLRNSAFARLFTGATASAAGTSIAAVSLPVAAVATLHASALAVGLLESAVWTPWLVLGLPSGAWVDRYSPRALVVVADSLSALLYAAVPVLAAFGVLSIWYLVLLALAAGSAGVVSQAAAPVLPTMVVADEDLESANSTLQGAESATDLFGPVASSALTQVFGVLSGLTANAVSFVVSVVCVGSIPQASRARPDPDPDGGERPSLVAEIRAGLRALFAHPVLRRLALTGTVINFVLTGVAALQALLLVRSVGVAPQAVGLLLVGEGVGGVLGAAAAPRLARVLGTNRALGLVTAVSFPVGVVAAFAHRGPLLALFVLGTTFPMVGVVCANVLMRTLRQRTADPGLLGRVSASSRMLSNAAAPAAGVLAGLLGSLVGIRVAYAALWAVALVPALSFLVWPMGSDAAPVRDALRDGAPGQGAPGQGAPRQGAPANGA